MARTKGPAFSLSSSGTIAGAIVTNRADEPLNSRGVTTRASPRLKFRRERTAPAPTSKQSAARARLAAATAYAQDPPPGDIAQIARIAKSELLPPFHAASLLWFRRHSPTTGTTWDDGATTWDSGATLWPD